MSRWPARTWAGHNLEGLQQQHGHRRVSVRLHPLHYTAGTVMEGDCEVLSDVALASFCAWLCEGSLAEDDTLSQYPRETWWGYCSYQHFETLFSDMPENNSKAVDFFDFLGLNSHDCSSGYGSLLEPSGAPTL
eukprot:1936113-Amphidinium_carterae.1